MTRRSRFLGPGDAKLSLNARSYAFDAGVIFLFCAGVPSLRALFDRVLQLGASGFVSEVNLAEFYYKTAEKKGVDVAEIQYRQVRGSPLKVVAPDENTTRGPRSGNSETDPLPGRLLRDCDLEG